MTASLFELTPEEREAAEALAAKMTALGFPLSVDEAQIMANLANYVQPTIDEDPRGLGTKATRELATGSALAQACLATLAKVVVNQHTLTYDDDVNLRALSLLQSVLAIVAALTQAKKLKHPGG